MDDALKAFICVLLIMAIVVVGFGYGDNLDFFKVMGNMVRPLERISDISRSVIDLFVSNEYLTFSLDDVIEVYELCGRPTSGSIYQEHSIFLGVLADRKNNFGTKNVVFLGATLKYEDVSLREANLGLSGHIYLVGENSAFIDYWNFDLSKMSYRVMTYRDFLLDYRGVLY